MISVFFNDVCVAMGAKTKQRGNRQIHKSENMESSLIPLNGDIKIYKDNKKLDTFTYNIHKNFFTNDENKWYQINSATEQFVVQINGTLSDDNVLITRVAIQELIGSRDILLSI